MNATLFGIVPQGQKRCARCHRYKDLTEFNHHRDDDTNRQPYCRECQHEYAREHSSGVHRTSRTSSSQTSAYSELYASYRRFRKSYEEYIRLYHDDPADRLTLEFDLGL